ncbi:MAG: radical SAM protein [Eggerthellaceae bacterium]|nr:radical SAM protein [Eggerthellaceae bacterium]
MRIQVFRILQRTRMAGPGIRFCLWVQGCSRHCEGCALEEAWPHEGGAVMDTKALLEQIEGTPGIEGVTFLGGEPFEQPAALGILAQQIQVRGLSVVSFTGYAYERLRASRSPSVMRLLRATDLLIDGPFEKDKFDLSRPWVGSSNQRFIFLSDRYHEGDLRMAKNQIEVRVTANGSALVNGMGDFAQVRGLIEERG